MSVSEERLAQVLLAPIISEKGTRLAEEHGQVAFEVAIDATKTEIAAAVRELFKVDVEAVQVVNVRGKMKRAGKHYGKRKNWKKAYVRLAEGADIDFASGAA